MPGFRSLLVCVALAFGGCERSQPVPTAKDAPSTGPRYEHTRATVTALAREAMRIHDVTGVSIALVDGQRVVWATGFGTADVSTGTAATENTRYRAGSLAKPLVALAVLQLAERGRLDLDAPIKELVPELTVHSRFEDGPAITPRHLLAHQSGLPSDHLSGMWDPTPRPWRELVGELATVDVPHPPGEITAYSNVGYTLLGVVIERAAGEPFETYMQSSVLEPAGMGTASFDPGSDDALARPHRLGEVAVEPTLRLRPAGGLTASVLDLAQLVRVMLAGGNGPHGPVVSRESVAQMLRAHNEGLPLDLDLRQGLAWMLTRVELAYAGAVAWQLSWTPHYHGQVILLPDHDLGVAVLSNSMTGSRVVDPLAIETLQSAVVEKVGLEPPDPMVASLDARPTTSDELAVHIGRYATDQSTMVIALERGRLRTRSLAGRAELDPLIDGTFDVRGLDGLRVGFETIAGRDLVVTHQRGVRGYLAQRIAETPIPAAWRRRLGALRAPEGGDEFLVFSDPYLHEQDGLLILGYEFLLPHPSIPLSMVLTPVSDDEARVEGLGRGKGETIRVVRGPDGERLRWQGYELAVTRQPARDTGTRATH